MGNVATPVAAMSRYLIFVRGIRMVFVCFSTLKKLKFSEKQHCGSTATFKIELCEIWKMKSAKNGIVMSRLGTALREQSDFFNLPR